MLPDKFLTIIKKMLNNLNFDKNGADRLSQPFFIYSWFYCISTSSSASDKHWFCLQDQVCLLLGSRSHIIYLNYHWSHCGKYFSNTNRTEVLHVKLSKNIMRANKVWLLRVIDRHENSTIDISILLILLLFIAIRRIWRKVFFK